MKNSLFEITPVKYSAAAIKVLSFNVASNTQCFHLHWHDRIEMLRVKSGKLFIESGPELIVVSPDEILFLSHKMLHKGYTMNESVEYDVLMFDICAFYNDTEICKNLLPAIYDGRASFSNLITDKTTLLCFDDICKKNKECSLETISLVYKLIFLLFENNLIELKSEPSNTAITDVLTYLEQNYNKEINIPSLCKEFGYSQAYFCRKFKQHTGLSPMSYLKNYRLEQARRKIKSNNLLINEVAMSCGFADSNYFTRCFTKHFGVSPTQFKKHKW